MGVPGDCRNGTFMLQSEITLQEDFPAKLRKEDKMDKNTENVVLCGASSYEQKYYFNQEFKALPEEIKKELQIMCVLFTEDIGGVLTLEFTPEGELEFKVQADDQDYLFDEIGSGLKIRQYQREKRELLEALELYYRVVFLGERLEGSDEE